MNPDDILHEHWIYMLPNGKHVEAVKGDDNHWRLWEYVSCWQGDRAGSGSYWDFKGMRRTNHYEIMESAG
jgi:hypothetical protein